MERQRYVNGLPVYRAEVGDDETTGMFVVSLVQYPAVERDFLYYAKDRRRMAYSVQDEEKRMVFGLVMCADELIYRRDGDFEYYITYTREQIERMAEKWLRQGNHENIDLNHSFRLEDGVYLREIFIKDSAKGIDPKGFEDVKDGSLFASYHVENDGIWDGIKDGTFKGFSLAGIFDIKEEYNNKKKEYNKMSKFERIKAMLAKALQAFGSVTTDKGILSWDGDDDLKAGDTVQLYDAENDTYSKPEDGSYSTSEGIEIVVENGVVKEIIDHSLEETENKDNEVAPEVIEAEEDNTPEEEPKVENPDGTTEDVTKAVEELRKEVNELFAKFDELVKRVEELEKKPLAEPATEEFKRSYKTTQAEGFGRLSEIMNATRK